MDRVMADYLARKMGYDARGDQRSGSYNISGQYGGGGDHRDMNYPPNGDMRPYPYPLADSRGGYNYPADNRGNDYGYNYPMDNRGNDYGYGYPMDTRQGVKGTGPYGIGGSMHYGRGDRADMADYNQYGGQGDQHKFKMPKLTKSERHQWKQSMRNVDGTHGPHYDTQQVIQAAEKLGIRFNHFDEEDLAIVMNMFYSDYCHVVKKYVSPEKELMFYADMGKAYFDDPDGPDPDDKLSRQYHCMTDHA